MKAMIFAAGLGTRLQPLTKTRPKALVEINGQSLLEITLRRLATAGIEEVVVNTHHFAEQIHAFFAARPGHAFALRAIHISHEPELLDTGGGLAHAAHFFSGEKNILVHNVDVLSDIDLTALVAAHTRTGALATLAAMPRDTKRALLFDSIGQLVGRRSQTQGDILAVKTAAPTTPLGFCGIHVVSSKLLEKLPPPAPFSIIETYLNLAAAGEKILAHRTDNARWRDCGRPENLRPLDA